MFELYLLSDEKKLNVVYMRCINCKRETSLFLKNTIFEQMVPKFVLNVILHHVVMSLIIRSNKEMKYEIEKNNHQYWLNKCPWYTISICLKMH